MESLGEKLKTARVEKGYTFDQICRETNISLRYLEALETENFDIFPGEPYIIGFIKNYGSYLELDVQKLISLYRALKIQEQPIPVEQLLKPRPKLPKFILPVFAALIVLCAAGWGIFHFITVIRQNQINVTPIVRSPVEFVMEGNFMERRFHINDALLLQLNNDTYRLELVSLGETVTIRAPYGSVTLDLGQAANVDVNNDGIYELRITVADFAKNISDMGALLHFNLMDSVALLDAAFEAEADPIAAAAASAIVSTIFPSLPSAFPFTLQVNFQGYCMFRWEILAERDRAGRNQRYFQRGDELTIQAQNGIRIWASNAGSANFVVIGGGRTVPVEIGSPGEVVVADVRWIRDEDNRFRLVLMRLEPN